MNIWITILSTGELHAGGLERCRVWFQEPVWVSALSVEELRELPFGPDGETYGCGFSGWRGGKDNHLPSDSISFGKLFGYSDGKHPNHVDGLATFVWEKIREHYGNTKFPAGWYEYEKDGKCKQSDFLLKVELSITHYEAKRI